ncbi:hypothetical protein RHIZ404_230625 [Rhizobium sp. EC-SD404]|nr:hypothetical protein RHIZ404_230625 [Rhizobium sp. EC-SD404]
MPCAKFWMSSCLVRSRPQRGHKKTGRIAGRFVTPDHFSYFFNVAASRPAKSPRDKEAIAALQSCVNSAWLRMMRP